MAQKTTDSITILNTIHAGKLSDRELDSIVRQIELRKAATA